MYENSTGGQVLFAEYMTIRVHALEIIQGGIYADSEENSERSGNCVFWVRSRRSHGVAKPRAAGAGIAANATKVHEFAARALPDFRGTVHRV
jgi:hypothetical protein